MEKELIKELDRTYLMAGDCQIDEDEYVLQMAVRGRLPGILPLSIAAKDGKKRLRLDVTACASIASRYQSIELGGSDLRRILSAVRDTAQRMPGLLMSVKDLYLDPECIFFGPGSDEVLLCYIPHISDTEPDSVQKLSEFLLKRINHADQTAAQLAYALYDQVSSESYVLQDVLGSLLKSPDTDSRPQYGSAPGAPSPEPAREERTFRNASHSSAPVYAAQNPLSGSVPGAPGFSQTNVRKLPPPGGKHGSNSKKERSVSGKKASRRKKRARRKTLVPALVILTGACTAIVVFRMDLSQVMGMGFLCAALIWMIHSSLEKRSNEGKNLWFDEDDELESDDQFYQSLRDELYAQGPPSPQGSPCPSCRPDPYDGTAPSSAWEERTTMLHGQSRKPALVSLQKDRCPDIALEKDHLILGKSRTQADVILPGDTISRRHARIERRMDGYYVTDMFSTNGTFLDGHRLESGQAVALKDGAQLTFASLHYRAMIPA